MEKGTAVKLVKAKALGCLDHGEDNELINYMETAEEFPWAELGEYQNLVSLLPLYLPLELPENELKENLKSKLFELQKQLAPVQEEEPMLVEEEVPAFEEEKIPDEVELEMPDITDNDESLNIVQDETQIEEYEETVQEVREEIPESKPAYRKDLLDEQREKSERRLRESIKKLDDEIHELDQTAKRNLYISVGLIIVLFVVMVFIYLTLSSRIGDQQDKLDRIKNDIGLVSPQINQLGEPFEIS
jgi:Fe2+ transport system protein B